MKKQCYRVNKDNNDKIMDAKMKSHQQKKMMKTKDAKYYPLI